MIVSGIYLSFITIIIFLISWKIAFLKIKDKKIDEY